MKPENQILNLTQHVRTQEQADAGVREPSNQNKKRIRALLTFDDLPTSGQIEERAEKLARIADAESYLQIMIGGAPFLMAALERAIRDPELCGEMPVYAFSRRESIEEEAEDGSIIKRNVFRHTGFVAPNAANQPRA